jgi:esterase/lipase superfamily enzyme
MLSDIDTLALAASAVLTVASAYLIRVATRRELASYRSEKLAFFAAALSSTAAAVNIGLLAVSVASRLPRPANYAVIKVFYATDRGRSGNQAPNLFYSDERPPFGGGGDTGPGPQPEFFEVGTSEVSIPRDHRLAEIERPSLLRLEFREDPEKHVVILDVNPEARGQYFSRLRDAVTQSEQHEALIFIHGYNTSFAEAIRRTAQIAYDLGFSGAPICYSWASHGSPLYYVADETNAQWTGLHLINFLKAVQAESGARVIHLIAHSMGNRPLLQALNALSANIASGGQFHEVILAAPI